VLIDRQAIRSKGQGLRLMSTKTDAGVRTLILPVWGRDLLSRRYRAEFCPPDRPVFPAVRTGGIRDPRNTARDIRRSLQGTGFEWASAHTIGRRSLATWMDLAGLSSRAAADQLGHRRVSVTTDTTLVARSKTPELLPCSKQLGSELVPAPRRPRCSKASSSPNRLGSRSDASRTTRD
jgi:integrase